MTKAYLKLQHTGAETLADMGTTGLVSWVLSGDSGNRWERFNQAARIVKGRKRDLGLFCFAILATGKQAGINLRRFHLAVSKRADVIRSVKA